MAWRVGDTPVVINSGNTTRILLRGATVYGGPPPGATPVNGRPPKKEDEDKWEHVKAKKTEASSYGVVYANDLAREAIKSKAALTYPVGSIIVREKLPYTDGDPKPLLLAVMIKRPHGFNPKGGDWEFLIADSAMTKIQERQKKGSCLDCHAAQRARDYVFPPPPSPR